MWTIINTRSKIPGDVISNLMEAFQWHPTYQHLFEVVTDLYQRTFHPLTDTISSGAPLTMLFSFSTNPVMEASLPFPLVGRSAVGDESDLLEAAMVNDPLTFFCIVHLIGFRGFLLWVSSLFACVAFLLPQIFHSFIKFHLGISTIWY